jgi:hypothetical protein
VNLVGQNVASRTTTYSSFEADRYPLVMTNALSQQTVASGTDLRFGQYTSATSPDWGGGSVTRLTFRTSPDAFSGNFRQG